MRDKGKIFSYIDWLIIASLCLLIFCLPFSKAAIESFILLAFILWITKKILGFRQNSLWGILPYTELNKALGIFIAANFVSVIFTVNYGLSLRGFFGKELKFLAVFFILVEVINNKKRLKAILISIIASAVLIAIDAGAQYFGKTDFIRGYAMHRLSASFSTPVGFSAWLIIIIPLLLGLLVSAKTIYRWFKIPLLILILLLLLCLLITYSRGAWLGFIIGILFAGFCFLNNFALKAKLLCLSFGIGLLLMFLILPQPIKAKIKTIGKIDFSEGVTINTRIKSILKTDQGSISIRLKLWKEALRITSDYPLTGCGLNTYSIVAKNYKSFDWGGIYPHNSFLQMSAETGLLGILAFLLVVYVFFKTGLGLLKKNKDYLVLGLLSGILGFLVHAFFDTHLYSLQLVVLFWYMLGLTMAVMGLGSRGMPAQNPADRGY
jgi:putative inorganic carbon (hco3(-)) transporter